MYPLVPTPAPDASSGRSGFGLLEAIVALAILAATLIPIFALISTSMNSAIRLSQSNFESDIKLTALETMRAVNPMVTPAGTIDLGAFAVRWAATPIAAPEEGTNYPAGGSFYLVGLFDCKVMVIRPDGSQALQFNLQKYGFKRIGSVMLGADK
jgi:hypothetical protein